MRGIIISYWYQVRPNVNQGIRRSKKKTEVKTGDSRTKSPSGVRSEKENVRRKMLYFGIFPAYFPFCRCRRHDVPEMFSFVSGTHQRHCHQHRSCTTNIPVQSLVHPSHSRGLAFSWEKLLTPLVLQSCFGNKLL